jgi:hypothetical protein
MGFRSMLYNIIGGPSRDEILRESLQLLSPELEKERQWVDISGDTAGKDFGVEDRKTISSQALLYFVKNPLIGLAVTLKTLFVFGRGPSVKAKHDLISEVVIDDFWEDPDNRLELTSLGAMQRKGNALQIEGNLFLALFVNISTGRVKIGSIPPTEIDEVITHPENKSKVLWYKRTFVPQEFNYENGHYTSDGTKTLYYKDWRNVDSADDIYAPPAEKRAKTLDGQEILVCHLKANCTDQQKFGFSETYRAHPWAKAYTNFLSDLASIWRTLAIFAAERKIQKGTKAQIQAAAAEMRTHDPSGAQQRGKSAAGSVRVGNELDQWVPIKTSGVTMQADDGRRLLLMVCAAMGVYEHYFGDGSNANLASTTAMELPMLKMFEARQAVFEELFRDIIDFVIRQSASASGGKLRGYANWNDDKSKLTLADPTTGEEIPQRVSVDFPPITQKDVVELIGALKSALTLDGNSASSTPLITARDAARECMTILGLDNVDELVEELYPEGDAGLGEGDLAALMQGLPPADKILPAEEAAVIHVMEQLRALRERVEAKIAEADDE